MLPPDNLITIACIDLITIIAAAWFVLRIQRPR